MKLTPNSMEVELIDLVALGIMMLLTIFPVFGSYGMLVQNYGLWFLGIVGLLLSISGGVRLNRFLVGYLLYILFSVFSVFWSVKIGGAYIRLLNMSQVFLVGIFISVYCEREENIQKLLNYYLCGTVLISVYCFIQDVSSFSSWSRLGRKAFESAGQNQIYYSCILIYSIIIVIYRVLQSRTHKMLYIGLLGFLYLCGLLTAVRKCLVIPIVFTFFYIAFRYKKHLSKLLGYTLIAFVFCLIGIYVMSKYVPSMYTRVLSFISDYSSGAEASAFGNSYSSRKWLREQAWTVFLKHPVAGVGIGQFRFYAGAGGLSLYAHNNFLEILANTGIIGFCIYYCNLFGMLRGAIYMAKDECEEIVENGAFVAAFLLAILVMEYGQVDYYQCFLVSILIVLSTMVDNTKFVSIKVV